MWEETVRLAALRSYDILDAPDTEAFDDFVQIAAAVCGTPIAVINLIDEARQWFAAELGLGVRETPLDVSICARAILQPGLTVVPDLSRDERFDCNPLVTAEAGLRFYGGAPLQTTEGLPIGTLCVLGYEPRPAGLNERQAFTLAALARQVMTQLELRRALKERKQAAAAMEALLAEKDLLMQEVHHRVKNSLATVQSLLLLQARAAGDDHLAPVLRESAGRVRIFGAMHEHLYRVGAAAEVDIAEYLGSLIQDQRTASAAAFGDRRISFEADGARWPSSEAPALGLIAVELITNGLKHGSGPISVRLDHLRGEAVLTVEDAGGGLPAEFDPGRSRGLGMRLVTGMLGGHRRGRLEIDRSRGHTCFVVTMKAPTIAA